MNASNKSRSTNSMSREKKLVICTRELYSHEQFIQNFKQDLIELLSAQDFMNIVRSISTGKDSSGMFSGYRSPEIQRFKQTLNQAMRDAQVYFKFPAYHRIADRMQSLGATQKSTAISVFYAVWLLSLKSATDGIKTTATCNSPAKDHSAAAFEQSDELVDFRLKWPAQYRCEDGHYVRSKNEMLVDNWLFSHGICHAYEKAVFSSSDSTNYCSDFFIPSRQLFIEIWGLGTQEYLQRKERKIHFYQSNGYQLLSIEDKDVRNLDDILSRTFSR